MAKNLVVLFFSKVMLSLGNLVFNVREFYNGPSIRHRSIGRIIIVGISTSLVHVPSRTIAINGKLSCFHCSQAVCACDARAAVHRTSALRATHHTTHPRYSDSSLRPTTGEYICLCLRPTLSIKGQLAWRNYSFFRLIKLSAHFTLSSFRFIIFLSFSLIFLVLCLLIFF